MIIKPFDMVMDEIAFSDTTFNKSGCIDLVRFQSVLLLVHMFGIFSSSWCE